MASSSNRDRLIQTFMARTNTGRRNTPPGYKPQKKSGLPMSFKPKKRARY